MGQVAKALALYKTFHAREPDFVTAVPDIELPDKLGLLGCAKMIVYASDKWRTDGELRSYFHPFESDVQCYVPWRRGLDEIKVGAWPGELSQLGYCVAVEVERPDGTRKHLIPPMGTRMCGTPDGRTLVLLHLQHGIRGALTGGRQRITDRGVEDG